MKTKEKPKTPIKVGAQLIVLTEKKRRVNRKFIRYKGYNNCVVCNRSGKKLESIRTSQILFYSNPLFEI